MLQTGGRAVQTVGPAAPEPHPGGHAVWRKERKPFSARREPFHATQECSGASHAAKEIPAAGLPVGRGHSAAAGALYRKIAIPHELLENPVLDAHCASRLGSESAAVTVPRIDILYWIPRFKVRLQGT